MGVAGTQAAGVREVMGSMTKPFHPGMAARAGVLGALLAHRGFTSATRILEGRRGFAAVMSREHDVAEVTRDLGERWELRMNGLKPYACGVVAHPLIDAMIALRSRVGPEADRVDRVDARVQPLVLELMDRPDPKIGLEGKFSFQHSMAVGFVDGAAFPAQYTDARVIDPEVAELRSRITARIDGSMPEDAAEVTLTMKDGSSYTETVPHATGAPENPITDSQLEAKFRTLASRALPRKRVERLLAMLWEVDRVPNVVELVRLTRMPRRTAPD
jgi:2-methylcitrate dehydratase PrpD